MVSTILQFCAFWLECFRADSELTFLCTAVPCIWLAVIVKAIKNPEIISHLFD